MSDNLNKLLIAEDGNFSDVRNVQDNSTRSENGEVAVYFRNLEDRLVECIKQADLVVGCVAWLTHEKILSALSRVPSGVAIVVQKEDFLRPDLDSGDRWKQKLRSMYKALPECPQRQIWTGLIGRLSLHGNPPIDAVRCVGNHNRDKTPAAPRMHNKFLVFCRVRDHEWAFDPDPYLVWTGSFNLTKSATNSLENAITISDSHIVNAYYREWEQIEAISEPLNWRSRWIEPEWRIGT